MTSSANGTGCSARWRRLFGGWFTPKRIDGLDASVRYPRGTEVDLDRGGVSNISFGAGPHRCLGSHLARGEMTIALEAWPRRIPDYGIAKETTVTDHAGNGVFGVDQLPLTWTPRR